MHSQKIDVLIFTSIHQVTKVHTLHVVSRTLHVVSRTLHVVSRTLHVVSHTLHVVSHTLHVVSHTLMWLNEADSVVQTSYTTFLLHYLT